MGYTYNGGKKGDTVKVIGYAGDLPKNDTTKQGKYQFEAKGSIKSVTTNRVFYDVDANAGQSGSPILLGSTVIGVHTHGATTQNSGKRIHYDMYEWMKEW